MLEKRYLEGSRHHDKNLQATHAIKVNWEQNTKDTMKLEWKRYTPQMANWKVTNAKETNLKTTHARKATWKWHTLWKQLESNTYCENSMESNSWHEI